jgi:DNA-binding MarR family transcriptional regulator
MKGRMRISEIESLYPEGSTSTISTTITKLWQDKELVDKKTLPENQGLTIVSLTEKGKQTLAEIKRSQADVYGSITQALGFSSLQADYFQKILLNAIRFFDKKLGVQLEDK